MKPRHQGGYDATHTDYCERTLVTLLRGLGPWKSSIYLIGGLVPRYLIQQPVGGERPPHIGTTDVDVVLDLDVLADVEAYERLEQNLKRMGFERGANDAGRIQHHRWVKPVQEGLTVVLDLLCDVPSREGPRLVNLSGDARGLSAVRIPGAHIVFHDYVEVAITAELLDDRGVATEIVRVAGIAPFVVLKAIAYDDRVEEKDAYDLVYTIANYEGGPEAAADIFIGSVRRAADDIVFFERAVAVLRSRFGSDETTEGHRKDGPTSYARFLTDPGREGQDMLNRRNATAVVEAFLARLDLSQAGPEA
jgi:hypothetical protein